MKGLPRDTGGAVILEGLSQSKQKEKQVKKSWFNWPFLDWI